MTTETALEAIREIARQFHKAWNSPWTNTPERTDKFYVIKFRAR